MHGIAETFGDFLLQGELGTGASGTVFQAQQLSLNRLVALKVFHRDVLNNESARRRFHVEAEAAAGLDHPAIVPVYGLGECEGRAYLSMKIFTGGTLAEAIQERTFAPTPAAEVMVELAKAVDHAHSHGVLHRDIKPDNILLDDSGRPHLADFGLAKLRAGLQAQTATHTTLGTPAYMAPELATTGAQAATNRSDIYSLGAVLYHALTGQPPYTGDSPLSVLEKVRTEDTVPLRRLRPGVPRDIEVICHKCLAREPAHRYGSARELAEDLERFLRGDSIAAREPELAQLLQQWFRRHRVAGTAGAALLLSLIIGLSATAWQWRRANKFLRETRASLTMAELREAENLAAHRQPHAALLKLAATVRGDPANQLARIRLHAALTEDDWPWPAMPPFRHAAAVRQGALHPDKQHLITASSDGWLHVWDGRSGEHCLQLPHDARRGAFALSRDGRFAATLATNGAAALWRMPGGERVFAGSGDFRLTNCENRPPAVIVALTFNPGASLLATAAADGRTALWSMTNTQCLVTLDHGEPLRGVSFDPAGRLLLTVGDKTCRLWRTAGGKATVISPAEPPVQAEFSPDGARLLIVAGGAVELWNVRAPARPVGLDMVQAGPEEDALPPFIAARPDPEPVEATLERRVRHSVNLSGAHFSADGQRLAAIGPLGVWMQRIPGKDSSDILLPHDSSATQCRLTQDGKWVVMASEDGSVRFKSATTAEDSLMPVRHEGPVLDICLSGDGSRLLTCSADGTARLWIARQPELAISLGTSSLTRPRGFSPDGNLLAVDGQDHILRLFWVEKATQSRLARPSIPHAAAVRRLAFSPDSRKLATVDDSGQVLVADTTGTNDLRLAPLSTAAADLWWSADCSQLAAQAAGEFAVWNVSSRPPGLLLRTNLPPQATAAFSPAGGLMAFSAGGTRQGGACASARLVVFQSNPHVSHNLSGPASRLSFSPDGRLLASLGPEDTVSLWRTADTLLATPEIRPGQVVVDIGFSADSSLLFTAVRSGAVIIWDTRTGHFRDEIPAGRYPVRHAEFAPDAQWMLIQRETGPARLWHVETGLPAGTSLPLRHANVQCSLTADGRRLLLIGSESRATYLRTPWTRTHPPEVLVAMTEYLTDQRPDGPGRTAHLTPEEFYARKEILKAALGSLPPISPRRTFVTHTIK